ncbi:uncharacterized protein LOC125827335 [Solanum verrucosum]|uniref:uncharacterized protein LOC125827335 n=1 Tax=Solanum verrucosum TaxID=315347 RepID=UPI0020D12A96|nr:uncharacterized protein LOC125827335 [Solanum verrucosum]
METYLKSLDLWEAVEEDYEINPLPNNPTVAQIKSHKEKKIIKSKAKATLFAAISISRMKESETVNEYSDRLFGIVNKADEERRLLRQDRMVEGALVASHKTQSKGKIFKNYQPCQHCGKNGHHPYKSWKRPDAQCKNSKQLGHEAVICKSKFQKDETVAQVTTEEEEQDHLFVGTCFSTKKYDFWMIDCGCTNHMTYERNLFKEFIPMENKKVIICYGDCIPTKGKLSVSIKTNSGTKIISEVLYVPDIDKSLFSVGQLTEKGFKLLFGDKYCRIFYSTKQEFLQVEMRSKSFSFNPTEDAHKPCKTEDELADFFTRSISDETAIYNS